MTPIVSVKWLKSHLDDSNLIILDASPKSTMSAHNADIQDQVIHNAIPFNIKEKFTNRESEYPNAIPSPAQFEVECRKLGISENSKIVVYDNLGIYTSPRVWWLFKIMGHANVSVLDGGLKEWIDGNGKVAGTYRQEIILGDFVSNFQIDNLIDYEEVKRNIKTEEYILLDARSNARFYGVEAEPRKHLKSGHLANSLNLPYTEVLENGKYKSKQELIKIFDALKLDDRSLIFSCGSGMTACITLLASEMVLQNKTLLYDGSWTEWAMKEGLLNLNKNDDMKTMTCKQLGGACDKGFTAATFNEIAAMSKKHGKEMFDAGDEAHLQAMTAMRELMHTEGAMEKWMAEKMKAFEAL